MIRRVLLYSGDFGIPVDGTKGASVHLRAVARAFVECGVEVVLASPRAGDAQLTGVRVIALPSRPRPSDDAFDPARMSEAHAALLRTLAPADLVYERSALWTTAGLAVADAWSVPHFVEVNAPLTLEAARWRTLRHADAARAAEERIARGATRLFPVSEPIADHLRACGAQPDAVVLLPNAVDPAFLDAGRRRLAAPRGHTESDAFTVCFVGSLKPWHGIETLLEAFRLLGGSASGYRLLIAGDGPLASLIGDAARDADGIEWMGAVPHEDVPAVLGRADVAVAPYRDDAGGYFSPLKVVEYQAAGVPVVASGGRGVEELVRDGGTGILFTSGDPASLARALATCRLDRTLAARLAADAFASVAHRTWRSVVERILREAHAVTAHASRA